MIIKIKVKPNSEKQDIIKKDDKYLVYVKSTTKEGKANMELLKTLKKHFNKPVRIKSGLISRSKMIEIGE